MNYDLLKPVPKETIQETVLQPHVVSQPTWRWGTINASQNVSVVCLLTPQTIQLIANMTNRVQILYILNTSISNA
jgi:hypothetical protein